MCASPVPLNEEQRKVLAALRQGQCRFFAIEGPPGCGKSHTIVAPEMTVLVGGLRVRRQTDGISSKVKFAPDSPQERMDSKPRFPERSRYPAGRIGFFPLRQSSRFKTPSLAVKSGHRE